MVNKAVQIMRIMFINWRLTKLFPSHRWLTADPYTPPESIALSFIIWDHCLQLPKVK